MTTKIDILKIKLDLIKFKMEALMNMREILIAMGVPGEKIQYYIEEYSKAKADAIKKQREIDVRSE